MIYIKILAFMLLFAILNRIRGGGLNWIWKNISNIAKPVIGAIIGSMAYQQRPEWWVIVVCMALYWAGESLGWGKWMATILDGKKRYEEEEGKTVIFGVTIWDGVHHIANKLCPEMRNYMLYSKIAMVIRGLYWWGPLFIFLMAVDAIPGTLKTFVALAVISAGFLASVLIAKEVSFKIDTVMKDYDSQSYSDKDWWESEVIYGTIQGLVFGLVFLL